MPRRNWSRQETLTVLAFYLYPPLPGRSEMTTIPKSSFLLKRLNALSRLSASRLLTSRRADQTELVSASSIPPEWIDRS